jgi:hypothetical protein
VLAGVDEAAGAGAEAGAATEPDPDEPESVELGVTEVVVPRESLR